MAKINVPEELPNCELLEILTNKVNQRRDTSFDFFGNLENFRKRVSNEARQINELFPEYTPHDEQYHSKRLFHVADTVLGRERLEAMNSAELFVLAIALYGHDWGMAVSEQEKQYILTGELSDGAKAEDLWILPDERDRLIQFAKEQNLTMNSEGQFEQFPIEMWREYVRLTHANRSSERIRRFFDSIDGGVAEAASRVCAGHWISFVDLQNYQLYPPDFAVLRETVNLRAIAVYLRLVDMLDLGEDRTPYVIWKFVAPRDSRSKMEWAKHRALQPVTCPVYQDGRIIQVDGSTDDHEVYAALEDFRIWCDDQLRSCNDTLARMNDSRHKLDLYHIEWRVAPRGFEPVSIQFEFDRERMFEILSDEIYNGDPYVFLRELLQNSIDAIRMRREVLNSKGIEPKNLGVIYVNVEHGDEGNSVITWKDDGIGMDEYIIRNYLAIAGNSFYRSSDFERQGLKMDPISRFGIGILSCFMVADHIEIETFKDPYLPPGNDSLKIIIPAINRQFRIEKRPQESAEVGTTVKVFVENKKLPLKDESKHVEQLDVTAYLSIIAGFVEFPIVINENGRKTIVLHPDQDEETARTRFGESFEVHKIDLSYPWSETFYPQDIATARELLQEKRCDINSDFALEGYHGIFSYLVPPDCITNSISSPREINFKLWDNEKYISRKIRWELESIEYSLDTNDSLSESSRYSLYYAVYRDGILLSSALPPISIENDYPFIHYFPLPKIVVNLPKIKSQRVDLGRSKILGESEHWDLPIFKAYLNFLYETSIKDILTLDDPSERLYRLGHILTFYNIDPGELLQLFPPESCPVPFLEAGGKIRVLELQELTEVLYEIPDILAYLLYDLVYSKLITQKEYNGPLTYYDGERCLIRRLGQQTKNNEMKSIFNLCEFIIDKTYRLYSIRFLNSPWEGDPPLLQKILHKKETSEEVQDPKIILQKTIENPTTLNFAEIEQLQRILNFDPFVEFPPPFEHYFAYGGEMLNLKHPITKVLLQINASLKLSKIDKTLPKDTIGQIEDQFMKCMKHINFYRINVDDFIKSLPILWSKSNEVLFNVGDIDNLVLTSSDFIPGAVDSYHYYLEEHIRNLKNIKSFGKNL